ncbi:sensor histidine kinase [Portibacter marinus]|uniref:sensor histidine kinase n=1 Tax=Portibacter marinus TaxID=2898660 RepID=UPI001F3AD1E9|nr:histidine kinase [Portibacter marinus]
MDHKSISKPILIIQIAAWIMAITLFYFYLGSRLKEADSTYLLGITLVSFTFHMILIYGYSLYLYPRFYKKRSTSFFIVIVIVFFFSILLLRMVIEVLAVGPLTTNYQTIFTFGQTHFLYALTSSFVALIIAILITSYYENLMNREELRKQREIQVQSELNHLKSQLSPHFLFNTLNTLYYDTYKVLPSVGDRISKMSELLRYFLDAKSQKQVSVKKEIWHLVNYIDLEKERVNDAENVHYHFDIHTEFLIPPMLFMPFAEKVFKHGMDEHANINHASFRISDDDHHLVYEVQNQFFQKESDRKGSGLKVLKSRLQLLYGERFSLEFKVEEERYVSYMKIPKDEY